MSDPRVARASERAGTSAGGEFSTSRVPDDRTIGALRIAMILVGVMIALPAFVMGAELHFALGARNAIAACFIGGLILAVIAALGGIAGARSRLSTYMLIIDAFGVDGAKLANGLLGFTLLGWFGVIAMMFAHALASAIGWTLTSATTSPLLLVGCAIVIATTIVGFRAIDRLSLLITPLKILLLLWTFFVSIRTGMTAIFAFTPATPQSLGTGISLVAGGLLVGATLAPDICRFARTPARAAIACAVAYGIAYPLVLVLSGFPSLAAGQKDLIAIMLALGLGLPAMLTVLFAAWGTNAYNLYATTLVLSTIAPKQRRWHLVLGAGIVGTLFGLLGVSELLVPYLLALSIAIPPIAGIYLANFYFGDRLAPRRNPHARWRIEAFVAWAAGIVFATAMKHFGTDITGVPALDSLLVSALIYFGLRAVPARAAR